MTDAADARQSRVRELAYHLWQQVGCPDGAADELWLEAENSIRAEEAEYDKTVADSFPASDPPAHSGIT